MRRTPWLALLVALAACSSAEEKQQERERRMIEQALADSAAEADFLADSLALAASITVDTIRLLRLRDVATTDEDGNPLTLAQAEAVAANGQVCALTRNRYVELITGDTLTCQWGPPP
ncbi:MAG TPA: hypothetical protein VE861_01985 [Gemmatimonadaceae bacterium]|nr:hypothetical protein [Gemmatimonadaceae bacterium]